MDQISISKIMNKYFRYIYILLIIILIGFVNSGDNPAGKQGESVGYGYGATPVDTEEDEDINFDTVVRELESLVTEDHQAPGDTVVSDNLLQHGLGHIIHNGYTSQQSQQPPQPPTHQQDQQLPIPIPKPTTKDQPVPYQHQPQQPEEVLDLSKQQPTQPQTPQQPTHPPTQQQDQPNQPYEQPHQRQQVQQPQQPIQPTDQHITQEPEQEEPLDLSKKPTQATQPQTPQQPTHPPTQQQDQPIPSQPSNLGPGILGPAPGPFREPSEILKEYDQLADKLIAAAKDKETKQQPTKESTQQTKEPTKEPQQEPTQQTTQPTELEPETIPVEIGSDDEEDEEPPEEPPKPSEPGDGDQPLDKPEERDEDGDEEDEDKYDKRKPLKENKNRCQSIKFYKKDKNGLPVEFNLFDYDIQWNDIFLTIYNFLISPFIIECDGMVVWERTNKNFKPKSMTYNKKHNTFVIRVRCHFLLQKLVNGKWQEYIFDIPKYVNLYREDTEGNIVLMSEFDYDLNLTPRGHFKYNVDGLKCCRIEYRNKGVLWEKTPDDNYPLIISLAERMGVLIYFEGKTQIYGRRKGVFKLLITKKNRRISRLK